MITFLIVLEIDMSENENQLKAKESGHKTKYTFLKNQLKNVKKIKINKKTAWEMGSFCHRKIARLLVKDAQEQKESFMRSREGSEEGILRRALLGRLRPLVAGALGWPAPLDARLGCRVSALAANLRAIKPLILILCIVRFSCFFSCFFSINVVFIGGGETLSICCPRPAKLLQFAKLFLKPTNSFQSVSILKSVKINSSHLL